MGASLITILDAPPKPNATDQVFCIGSIGNLMATANTGGTLNWYDDAGLTSLVGTGGSFDHGQTTMGTYDYWVAELSVNLCEGPARQVQLTINQPPEVVVQPVDQTECEGGNAMFVVDAGATTNPFYQWQEDNGSGWISVIGGPYIGQTTDTLRIIGVTSIFDAYKYRVVVSGTCAPNITSNQATLTVLETPEILVQPVDFTECEGQTVSFVVDPGVTSNPVYQWEENNGGGWISVIDGPVYSGSNTDTLTLTSPTPVLSGYQYRISIDNSCGSSVMSDVANLTIEEVPVITSQPTASSVCEDDNALFSATATGPALIYQWQENDGAVWTNVIDGANYSGSTTNNLNLTNLPSFYSGYKYRLDIITVMGCQVKTDEVDLTVFESTEIIIQPTDVTTCENLTTVFTVDPGVTTNPVFQWEYNDGISWMNVLEIDPYIGSQNDSLAITNTQVIFDGYKYRVTVSNICGPDVVSGEAVLTVAGRPTFIQQPVNIKTKKPGIVQFVAQTAGVTHTKSWLRSQDDGLTWNPITDGAKYSGTATDTLTLINPSPGKDILYEMKLSTLTGCDIFSDPVPVGVDFHYQVDETTIYLTGMAPEYQYQWSFGDGEFSNLKAPTYTYAVPGLYEVCLTAFDDVKDSSEETCKVIQLGTVDCQAQFDYTISGTDSLTIFIADASTGAIKSWYWTFGDGSVSEKKEPAHVFAFPGMYKVCLTTLDTITGCQSHVCQNIKVGKETMVADFIHITNDTNQTVLFSDQSTGDITHWYWTFGDGESFIGKETSHTYDRPGLYEVCLFTNNSVTGDFAESCKKIRVGETPCNIKAEFISFISNKNLRVAFNDRSNGHIEKWFWNFGDGISSTLINPVHIYERNGLYEVGLSVRDSMGNCYDYYTELIQVGEIDCKADFEYSVDPAVRTVTFNNRSTKNTELSFWSFGDGEFEEGRDPEHTYSDVGVFGVTLTIVDSTGQCMDSKFEKIQVGSVKCQVEFTYYIDSAGNKAFFTSHLLGDPTQVVWTFGDGSSSDELNPVHQYAAGGFYKVGLNAYNDVNGCMDYLEKIILISTRGEDCLADFIYTVDMSNLEVSFTERSTGNIETYIWDFGDRNVVEANNPVHSYARGGFYLVCLTVQNEFGISNTTCKYIQVAAGSRNNCLADYYFSIDSAGTTVSLVDASFGKPDEWTWEFGDEQSSDLEEPVHLYAESGIYRVGMRIRNSATGCVSKVYKLIDAGAENTGLYASFVYEIDSTDLKADSYPVDFIGISLGDSKKFKWDFGDGETDSTSIQPRHEYLKPAIFDACFGVYNPITGEENISCDEISTIPSGIKHIGTNAFSLVTYPNPFNDKLIMDYYIPAREHVDISVYDFTGRKISSVVRMNKLPGNHTAEFDCSKFSAGLYYVVMQSGNDYLINKVVKQ